MRWRVILVPAAVSLGAFVAGASAQEAARSLGAVPSHIVTTKFDMSVGVTAGQEPRRAVRFVENRDVVNVPGHYGALFAITSHGDDDVLWYRDDGGMLRNAIATDPAKRLLVVAPTATTIREVEQREK